MATLSTKPTNQATPENVDQEKQTDAAQATQIRERSGTLAKLHRNSGKQWDICMHSCVHVYAHTHPHPFMDWSLNPSPRKKPDTKTNTQLLTPRVAKDGGLQGWMAFSLAEKTQAQDQRETLPQRHRCGVTEKAALVDAASA